MKTSLMVALLVLSATAARAQTQTEMNVGADRGLRAADAGLNLVYRALVAKARPAGKAKLRAAQRSWLAYRDAQCAFETIGTAGGSIHPMVLSGCLEKLTRDQTARLNAQLHCQEGDLSCGGQ